MWSISINRSYKLFTILPQNSVQIYYEGQFYFLAGITDAWLTDLLGVSLKTLELESVEWDQEDCPH